ncbi:protein YgfX [Shewanella sp. 125m-7]
MDVQQHSVDVRSSFGQCLSLAVIALVCLSSFLIWPYAENTLYSLSKSLLFIACSIFFMWQFWRLRKWRCSFVIRADSTGKLVGDMDFVLIGKPVITPFAVMFDVSSGHRQKRVVVWADMLDDTNFRHLCRLLQLATQSRATNIHN